MLVQNGISGYVLFPIFPCSIFTLSLVHVRYVVMLQDLVYFFNKAITVYGKCITSTLTS